MFHGMTNKHQINSKHIKIYYRKNSFVQNRAFLHNYCSDGININLRDKDSQDDPFNISLPL